MISRLTAIIPVRNEAQRDIIANTNTKELDAIAASNYTVKSISREEMKCKLIHGSKNRFKDLIVTAVPDEEAKKIEWDVKKQDGTAAKMPPVLLFALENFKFFDIKRHTYSCLVLALTLIKDASASLRPQKEVLDQIQGFVDNAIRTDPRNDFDPYEEIYRNQDSVVYMARERSNGKIYIMKEAPIEEEGQNIRIK